MERIEVISAIGTIGTADDETGNGATNEAAATAARKANAKRFVLVSASKDSSAKPCGGSWKMLEDVGRRQEVCSSDSSGFCTARTGYNSTI